MNRNVKQGCFKLFKFRAFQFSKAFCCLRQNPYLCSLIYALFLIRIELLLDGDSFCIDVIGFHVSSLLGKNGLPRKHYSLNFWKYTQKEFCIAEVVATIPKRELNIKIFLLLSQSHSLSLSLYLILIAVISFDEAMAIGGRSSQTIPFPLLWQLVLKHYCEKNIFKLLS